MTDRVRQLQGVWFPTRQVVEGQLLREGAAAFPAPQDVPLLSVVDDAFHVSVNAEHYLTGGRFLLTGARAMEFVYPGVPEEYNVGAHFVLVGDKLRVWSRPSYVENATRYVRVAPEPTPEMLALFESIVRGPCWAECACDRER